MAKKLNFSEAAKKAEPKVSFGEYYCRDCRNQERNQERYQDRDTAKSHQLSATKRIEDCPCEREKQMSVEITDTSESSVRGLGFAEYYRNRFQEELDYEGDYELDDEFDYTALKGYSKEQRRRIPGEYPHKPTNSELTLAPSDSDEPNKPLCLPLTDSYLRSIFRSSRRRKEPRPSRWQTEESQGFSPRVRLPKPSSKSPPQRIPFKKHSTPRFSSRFSPRFHPRHKPSPMAKSRCQIEPEDNYLDSSNWECNECPSLGTQIASSSKKNLDMNIRSSRIRGGSSRMLVNPCCGCPLYENKPKQSSFKWDVFYKKPIVGEDLILETLLSPRNLDFSQSSCSERSDQSQGPSSSNFESAEDEFHLSLPEVLSSSEPELDCRCSRGEKLPSLASRRTFTNIWRRRAPRLRAGSNMIEAPFTGGLYGRVDKLKFQTIDRLDAGYSLAPLFEGSWEETRERIQYFAIEFDRLTIKERMLDTELRFRQLRILQAKSDETFLKHFQETPPTIRPMPIKGEIYECPIGHPDCPAVTNETVLSHKLLYHLNERGLELREIFMGDHLLHVFNPRTYVFGRNSCMAALAYAGVYQDRSSLPGKRFMPTRNRKLPELFAQYRKHLPIFVMICRNQRSAIEGLEQKCGDSSDGLLERDDVLTLWAVSVDLPQPMHVMMTVLNRRMDATRSCIMQVRSLHKSQNCLKIMNTSCQYMRIGAQDLRILTSDGTEPIYLEVTVKEYVGPLAPKLLTENRET